MILYFHKKKGEKRTMSYDELLKNYTELKEKYEDTKIKYEDAKLQLDNLKRVVFGTKREYTPKQEEQVESSMQCSLFDDNKKENKNKEMEDDIEQQLEENIEEITVHRKKNKRKKIAGIKKDRLKDVEVTIKEYKLNKDVRCPECNGELAEISKKIVRQEIKYIPAKLEIINYVQYTYKCKECGTKGSKKDSCTILHTESPRALLKGSFASPSLATEVIYQKYYLGVPLYRQEKMWDDKGLVLPRNMMANWNIKINEYYLEGLYNLMNKKLKENSELLHCDETTIQCNKEEGRKASSKSYMWVMRTGELEKQQGIVFKYAPSRSAETAKEFLKGYKNILVTDGYASYNDIKGVTHAECWAHARRYFYDSIPTLDNKQLDTTALGYVGVTYCDKLFKIEREIALLSVEEKVKKRQEKSQPILEKFYEWVQKTLNEKVIINKKLKEALTYTLNQRKELSEFLSDGRIPLTNSLAERSIRPFAVHRKNWLFADSKEGAKANAVYYSLIESAKINNLNIEKYITYLLEELPQLDNPNDEKVLEKYLPWSNNLPNEILNFQGTYEELKIDNT